MSRLKPIHAFLGTHPCTLCGARVRVYEWLPDPVMCAKCKLDQYRQEKSMQAPDPRDQEPGHGTTTVQRILRFGTKWTAKLACGCTWELTPDELKQTQLFVGKVVLCPIKSHRA